MSRVWSLYSKWLELFPVQTNLVTSFFVGFFGDSLAQTFEKLHEDRNKNKLMDMSLYRSLKVGTFFVCSSYPLFHWYRFLDVRFPTTFGKVPLKTAIQRVVPKVLTNQCIAGPINNSFFYCYVIGFDYLFHHTPNSTEKQPLADSIKAKLVAEMPTTTKNSFCLFGPLHTINFLFLPSQTRILFNSLAGVSWVCYLSIMGHKRNI